ncbi:hypothetical protein DICVIV_08991 [Dictyocaulus viviparus]|uniref:Uncharacterized protein n=1 Tax=Dictyocaulus viviparus TaxID=29172 RepID=A0A0D8XMC4_DICVI|nr:hypothetical protein DICVIV_08991 [Dictyocaulus viviparus]
MPKYSERSASPDNEAQLQPASCFVLDQITDELYQMFCREVLDERPQNCSSTERKLLDDMSSSGNFGEALNCFRERYIEKVIAVKKSDPNPICAALAHIQQLFVGFPPEIRGLLVRRCSAKSDLQQSSKAITPRRCSARISKSKECLAVDSKNGIVNINESIDIPFTTKSTPKPKPMYINLLVPLDDYIYDKIAEVLAGRCSLESIEDESLRLAIENIRDSGDIIVEDWVEEQFFCPPGLRLRANDEFGRILVRKSEVAEVWRMCYATLNDRSQNEILNAVEAQYVGIATKTNIDILAMEDTMYGERSYNQALFLTDLYSGYSFARALTDCLDLAIIVRHVMDIFGSFGPPEAYRTFSLEYSAVIIDVMSDIERLFKIPIKNIGVGLFIGSGFSCI